MVQSPISNYYIKVKLDDRNGEEKNELHQKVFLLISVSELHIYMINKDSTGFPMEYDEKGLVWISDYDILLIIPP